MSRAKGKDEEKLTRVAIVSADRCKPKKCRQECRKSCPVNRMGKSVTACVLREAAVFVARDELQPLPGKLCIEVTPQDKIATISESLCIGCGICVKVGVVVW